MNVPLSEKLRPNLLSEIVGQDHLLADEGWIAKVIGSKKPLSILLYGPPGCGKTTLARIYAKAFSAHLVTLSAVFSGVSDIKKVVADAKAHPLFYKQTILFVDEIHRFNKVQQDAFLPFLEDGTLILIGATTENPSFSLNNALLSRLRVVTLKPLDASALKQILARFEKNEKPLRLTEEAREYLIEISQGDGRHLLNMIENLVNIQSDILDLEKVQEYLQKRRALYDKHDEGHYNLISALHKAVRGSDPDAAIYWLARMLEGGEDPLYLARRMIRMAVEDIGLADIHATKIALEAWKIYHMLGSPEGELALARAIIYLALAPKSNAIYKAYSSAMKVAKTSGHLDPPKIILNAPTKLMKEWGYGKDYQYDHDLPEAFSGQDYFPENLERQSFYQPVERGFERDMKKRLDYFNKLRKKIK